MVSRLTGRYHENVTVPTTTLVNTTEHHSVWQHRVPHRERHSRQPCPHSAGFSTSRCAKCTSSSTVPCFYWCVPANDTCLTAASQCLLPSCCLVIHPAGSSRISRPSAGDQRHQRGACGESPTLWHRSSGRLIVIQRLSFDKSNQHKPHTWRHLMNSHTLLGLNSIIPCSRAGTVVWFVSEFRIRELPASETSTYHICVLWGAGCLLNCGPIPQFWKLNKWSPGGSKCSGRRKWGWNCRGARGRALPPMALWLAGCKSPWCWSTVAKGWKTAPSLNHNLRNSGACLPLHILSYQEHHRHYQQACKMCVFVSEDIYMPLYKKSIW